MRDAPEFVLVMPDLRAGLEPSDYWRGLTEAARAVEEETEMDPHAALEFWCRWLVERTRHNFDAVVVITGDEGCHARGTKLLMLDGSVKNVEDVTVGDRLMGPDSKARTVLSLVRGTAPLYTVRPRKTDPWVVNGGHLITYAGRRAHEYPPRDTLGWSWARWTRSGYVREETAEWATRRRGESRNKMLLSAGELRFDHRSRLLLPPYLLGVVLGDGGLTSRVDVTTQDPEIREMVERETARLGDSVHTYPCKNGVVQLRIHRARGRGGAETRRRLRKLGLFPIACEDRFVPDPYRRGSVRERRELLAGLIDTDGSVSPQGLIDITWKSRRLTEDAAFVARTLGFMARVRPIERRCQTGAKGRYWRLSLMGDSSSLPLRVAHKRERLRAHSSFKDPRRQGYRVEPLGRDGEFFGFELDQDQRYVMADGVITHNSGKSTLALRMALECARLGKVAWSPKEVCYSAVDLIKAYQVAKKGKPIWYDEGVRGTQAGEQMLPEQRAIVKALALVRESGAILFALYPSIWLAAKQVRARRTCLWIHVVHRGLGRVHERDRRLNYLPTDALGLAISPRAPHVAWAAFAPNSKAWTDYLATKTLRLHEFLEEVEKDLKMRAEPKAPKKAPHREREEAARSPARSSAPTETAEARTVRLREATRLRVAKWRKKHAATGRVGVDKPPSVESSP